MLAAPKYGLDAAKHVVDVYAVRESPCGSCFPLRCSCHSVFDEHLVYASALERLYGLSCGHFRDFSQRHFLDLHVLRPGKRELGVAAGAGPGANARAAAEAVA